MITPAFDFEPFWALVHGVFFQISQAFTKGSIVPQDMPMSATFQHHFRVAFSRLRNCNQREK